MSTATLQVSVAKTRNSWMARRIAKVEAGEGRLPDFTRPVITVPRKPVA